MKNQLRLSMIALVALIVTLIAGCSKGKKENPCCTEPPSVNLTVKFWAEPQSVPYNEASMLKWEASEKDAVCTATGGPWAAPGNKGWFGSESTGKLTSSQEYEITCTWKGQVVPAKTKVNVGQQASCKFSAVPARIDLDSCKAQKGRVTITRTQGECPFPATVQTSSWLKAYRVSPDCSTCNSAEYEYDIPSDNNSGGLRSGEMRFTDDCVVPITQTFCPTVSCTYVKPTVTDFRFDDNKKHVFVIEIKKSDPNCPDCPFPTDLPDGVSVRNLGGGRWEVTIAEHNGAGRRSGTFYICGFAFFFQQEGAPTSCTMHASVTRLEWEIPGGDLTFRIIYNRAGCECSSLSVIGTGFSIVDRRRVSDTEEEVKVRAQYNTSVYPREGKIEGCVTVILYQKPSPPVEPPPCTPASITSHPSSRTITSGQSTTLSASATGTSPISYQWYTGSAGNTSSPISGPSGSSSSLTVSPNATTSYWVRVSNACGTDNSSTATVTVSAPTQPCGYAVEENLSIGWQGGPWSSSVTTNRSDCQWSFSNPSNGVTITRSSGAGTSTTGGGGNVTENPGNTTRTLTVRFNGITPTAVTRTVTITQDPRPAASCQVSVQQTLSISWEGGPLASSITTNCSGTWTAVSNNTEWLTLRNSSNQTVAQLTGTGSGQISLFAAGSNGNQRTATATVTDPNGNHHVITVTQLPR